MRKKILIVDDELDMRTYLSTLLKTSGYVPVVATNGLEAMQKAKAVRPHLIILDVLMPREGGIQLYRRLKRDDELKDIPVIMLSGIAKKTFFHAQSLLDRHEGQEVPEPEAYIEKPPEPEELLKWITALLGAAQEGQSKSQNALPP